MRARVEARATLEQAEELRRTLVELGERLRGMRRRWHLEVEVLAGEEV
jgi:hypothetical protein